jgi:hypothetical protein
MPWALTNSLCPRWEASGKIRMRTPDIHAISFFYEAAELVVEYDETHWQTSWFANSITALFQAVP